MQAWTVKCANSERAAYGISTFTLKNRKTNHIALDIFRVA